MGKMTLARRMCLFRSAGHTPGLPGTAVMYEYQAGRTREMYWLVRNGLAKYLGGRLVATPSGRRALQERKP